MTKKKTLPPIGRKMKPIHPGEILRELVLPDHRLNVGEVARLLRTSPTHMRRILATKCRVTPEMAVRLGALFGTGSEMWLNMQAAHDLSQAQKALRKEIPRISAAGEELTRRTDTEYPQAA